MTTRLNRVLGCWLALAAMAAACVGAEAQGNDETRAGIEAKVGQIAGELSAICPIADPGDQKALEACRGRLFRGSLLRRSLNPILLWGRPKPGAILKDTNLTQFAPEAWIGLYAPMFMFDGTWWLR